MSIQIQTAQTVEDLEGILELQEENHITNLEDLDQGFVFARHDVESLAKMHGFAPHVVAKDGDTVAAYVLAMTEDTKYDIPELMPMFNMLESLEYDGKRLSEYRFLVVGQVCVSKDYRGMGIFDAIYEAYREIHSQDFEMVVTEINAMNGRSLRAHERVGFQEITRYEAEDGQIWCIVLWDWR
jgi:predicted GNAT superfamily acetyltransferase